MESQCHTGLQCVYDTVTDKGWRSGIGYHKIHNVIDTVIRKYPEVPKCVSDPECVDCFNWKFFESNGSDPVTSKTTTQHKTTYTRTTTCKTPGWWGCLDESSTSTSPILTTTYTTTTCLTPGWFGCKETANTTITTTTAYPTTSPKMTSTTCRHGWFGDDCGSTSSSTVQPTPTQTSSEEICETPGIFFGCWDDEKKPKHSRSHSHTHNHTHTQTTIPSTITSPPTSMRSTTVSASGTNTTLPEKKCKHPLFFGLICLDSPKRDDSLPARIKDGGGHSSEL